MQALVAAGVDPDRAAVEAYGMDIPGESTSGRPYDAMTMNQAMDYVTQRFRPWTQDPTTGEWSQGAWAPGWNEDRALRAARAVATGDYSMLEPEEISTGGIAAGPYTRQRGIDFGELLRRYEEDPFGQALRDRGVEAPVRERPRAEPVMTDEEIAAAREAMRVGGYTLEEFREELIELGVTEADIERIIGG
jgi:hypothetical protein